MNSLDLISIRVHNLCQKSAVNYVSRFEIIVKGYSSSRYIYSIKTCIIVSTFSELSDINFLFLKRRFIIIMIC